MQKKNKQSKTDSSEKSSEATTSQTPSLKYQFENLRKRYTYNRAVAIFKHDNRHLDQDTINEFLDDYTDRENEEFDTWLEIEDNGTEVN